MEKAIKHQYFFNHPPQIVWEYFTKAELMALWLMPNDFQPVVGHEFQFKTGPIPSMDFDGIVYCKVLEIVPFEKLSYSWKSGPGNGEITLDTVVVWKLEQTEKGTEVFLEHTGFTQEANLKLYEGLSDGWKGKFGKIEKLINEA